MSWTLKVTRGSMVRRGLGISSMMKYWSISSSAKFGRQYAAMEKHLSESCEPGGQRLPTTDSNAMAMSMHYTDDGACSDAWAASSARQEDGARGCPGPGGRTTLRTPNPAPSWGTSLRATNRYRSLHPVIDTRSDILPHVQSLCIHY